MTEIKYEVDDSGYSKTICTKLPSFKASSQSFESKNVYVGTWACNHCDNKMHHDYENKIISCLK